MSVILRNNAAVLPQVQLTGGGSGRGAETIGFAPVKPRFRFPSDPAAELLPSAEFLGHETDFAAILEDFEGSPFDPSRRRVLGRLMGMFAMDYQGARAEERRFLRRLLLGRNAREGYAANRALHLCQVPHVIRRTLALAVAESRFAKGPISGFMGAVQARVAATTFMLLGPRSRERVWNLLTLAGTHEEHGPLAGADRLVERALLLKAVAARRHLLGPWCLRGGAALDEVETFAREIRGSTRAHLAVTTTLAVPGEETLPGRGGPSIPSDAVARAALVARAEIDPLLAWERHGRKRGLAPLDGAQELAGDEALPDLDRNPLLDRVRLHQALAEARLHGDELLALAEREALIAYVTGRELTAEELAKKEHALAVLEQRGFDVLRVEALEAIRADASGIYRFDAARAFGTLVSRYTGAMYVRRVFSDQLTAGAEPLKQIARALAVGLPVPVLLSELKRTGTRPLTVLKALDQAGQQLLVQGEARAQMFTMPSQLLLTPVLPDALGPRTRADAFLAPAALDLLAPPFGIQFPSLGIEDRL